MNIICPNCAKNLNDSQDFLMTEESKLFKGHNVYLMCKHCGFVMIYNKSRETVYGLDAYKDDIEVLKEIESLICNQDDRYALNVVEEKKEEEPVQQACSGNCTGCTTNCNHEDQQMLLAYNKETNEFQLITEDKLSMIDIEVNEFFLLEPVVVEKVVSYKIQKL